MNIAPKLHVVWLSYYFPPMGGGGVQRVVKFLKYWDYTSYSVSVLTVKNSHFYAEDRELEQEVPSGVRIVRTGSLDPFRLAYLVKNWLRKGRKPTSPQRESGSLFRKISSFLFLPDSRVLWFPFAWQALARVHRKKHIDLLVTTVSPFTAGLVGALAQLWWGIPHVLDMRDAWTNNPFHMPSSKLHRWLQHRLEAFTLRHSDAIVFVSPKLQEYYLRKYPSLKQKTLRVIRNGFDEDDFNAVRQTKEVTGGSKFRLGIFGTIYSHGNWPTPLLAIIRKWKQEEPHLARRIQLVFVGKWSQDFLRHLADFGLEEVISLEGYLPHRKMLQRAQEMDALCISHDSRPTGSAYITPGRIYEFLALRKPILALCHPESDIAHLVKQTQSGEVVEYTDSSGIEKILKSWLQQPSTFFREYHFRNIEQFSRRKQTAQILDLIRRFLPSR